MVAAAELKGFGVTYNDYPYKDASDWYVAVRPLAECFAAQPTYLLSEMIFITIALLTLIHSFVVGGRWKYFWVGTLVHGLTTELVSFALPDIDSYWHSQTAVIFLGRRLPLHIPLIYPSFMYIAAYTTAHMKLPRWAEPLAAGLTEVLMDIPYDIMAVKFVHWTWHDTDPNIFDRHYHVPWNSYYFHLAFGTAFNFALAFWRRKITGHDEKGRSEGFFKEMTCAILAGLCGMPGGVLQFISLYHPLHDIYNIHTETCVFFIFILYILIVWSADRTPFGPARRERGQKTHWSVVFIIISLVLHYSLYLSMAVFGNPQKEVSIGLHQTIGDCSQKSDVFTAFGGVLKKNTYLCASNYDESYFSLNCGANKPVPNGASWYTICGTPFPNQAEYISVLTAITVFAIIFYYNLLFKSAPTLVHSSAVDKKKKKN